MKLSTISVKSILTSHIYDISLTALEAMAFILDIAITDYKKNPDVVKFTIQQQGKEVMIESAPNASIYIADTDQSFVKHKGYSSFADCIYLIRTFHFETQEVDIACLDKLALYDFVDLRSIIMLANKIIDGAA